MFFTDGLLPIDCVISFCPAFINISIKVRINSVTLCISKLNWLFEFFFYICKRSTVKLLA